MPITCPHCQNAIEPSQDAAGEIVCTTCGSTFRLEQERTRTYVAEHRHLGKFELIEQVGSGAFGTVWRARDTELGRIVAIKIPQSGLLASDKEAQRFDREARSAAQLRHPGIVTLHEVGRFENSPYLVSDFIQGLTLTEYLEAHRPSHRDSAELVAQVAEALDYAHAMGVVHRDVKPSNIMLERGGSGLGSGSRSGTGLAGSSGRPLLMDFGLALRADVEATMTQEGEILGTPAYMSPEQAAGQSHKVDARSDVYSLGVVLYRLLTGQLPFQGNARVILDQLLNDEPAPPRKLDRTVARDLETICLKAMAKTPANRYPTARAFAEDLRRYLAGEPITARAVASWERVLRWARRRPAAAAAVGLGGVAALTLVGLTVALGYQARLRSAFAQVDRQRSIAEEQKGIADRESKIANEQRGIAEIALAGERRFLYYNRLIFAERELQDNNPYRAEALLNECPADRRHWEWNYLKRQCHTELLTLPGHQGPISSVAYSTDGRLIASGGFDQTVRVWDAETGREVRAFQDHGAAVWSVAFSPDGRHLASLGGAGDRPGQVLIRDVATWRTVRDITTATGINHAGLALSQDSRNLAIASGDAGENPWVQIYDTASGQTLRKISVPDKAVYSPSFTPDGKRLAAVVGSGDPFGEMKPAEVWVWDLATGEVCLRLRGHTAPVMSAEISPDGRTIASAGYDATVRIWDAADGRLQLVYPRHRDCVNRIAYSPDGRRIASPSDDGSAHIWDVETGQLLLTLRGHRGPFFAVAFRPDGRRLVTAGNDGAIKLWDAVSGNESFTLSDSGSGVSDVAFSPDGRTLATGGIDRVVRIWAVDSGRLLARWTGHSEPIRGVAFSPDGTLLASAAGDWRRIDQLGEVTIWDTTSGQVKHALRAHRGVAWSVAFSPDGKRLVSGGGQKRTPNHDVIEWDVDTGQAVRKFDHLNDSVKVVTYSPDGHQITAAIGKEIHVWSARTGTELMTLQGHEGAIESLVYSPDGRRVVSCGDDLTVKVWDAANGRSIQTLEGKVWPMDVAVSPDSRRIASASYDRTIHLWDAETGQELITLRGHAGVVLAVAFSPDGHTIASSDQNGLVKLWDGSPLEGGAP